MSVALLRALSCFGIFVRFTPLLIFANGGEFLIRRLGKKEILIVLIVDGVASRLVFSPSENRLGIRDLGFVRFKLLIVQRTVRFSPSDNCWYRLPTGEHRSTVPVLAIVDREGLFQRSPVYRDGQDQFNRRLRLALLQHLRVTAHTSRRTVALESPLGYAPWFVYQGKRHFHDSLDASLLVIPLQTWKR
jgi:hypothetical protein